MIVCCCMLADGILIVHERLLFSWSFPVKKQVETRVDIRFIGKKSEEDKENDLEPTKLNLFHLE